MVPAGGRAKVTYLFSPPRRTIGSTPAWYPATYQLRGRQPRRWATRLSRPAVNRGSFIGGTPHVPGASAAPRAVHRRHARRPRGTYRGGQGRPRAPPVHPGPPLPAGRGDAL